MMGRFNVHSESHGVILQLTECPFIDDIFISGVIEYTWSNPGLQEISKRRNGSQRRVPYFEHEPATYNIRFSI
jgi:hypothetical protein